MDYYILVTNECNLRCTYCSIPNIVHSLGRCSGKPTYKVRDLVSQVDDGSSVMFSGGEPLLNPEFIRDFIAMAGDKKLTYILQTNGTLLNHNTVDIVKQLDYLHVSIDGHNDINDSHRGQNVYASILSNMNTIRPHFHGNAIARMTLTARGVPVLCKSVTHLLEFFDGVYWQIENNRIPNSEGEKFLEIYSKEISDLTLWWTGRLTEGKIFNIVPFVQTANTLLSGIPQRSLRCGCGKSLVVVDVDGKCYACDELMNQEHSYLGSISGVISLLPIHENYLALRKQRCGSCQIFDVCAGRCYHQLYFFDETLFQFYCEATKILVLAIQKILPIILESIKKGRISRDQLDIKNFNEGIP